MNPKPRALRLVSDARPMPPVELTALAFAPAHDLSDWAMRTFIDDTGALSNPSHSHLQQANIGFLWTGVGNSRGGRVILGQAELMPPMAMGKWAKAKAEWQLIEWFGDVPDFLITVAAGYAVSCDDVSFCALVEHELLHCAHAIDDYGQPRFRKNDGSPIFAIRGHDVEEFVDVVARYGAEATNVEAMARAANMGPSIGVASVAAACGTCAPRRRA